MRIFWCSDHAAHDPGRLPQPAGGSENYYSEVAERCTVLLDALAAAEVGEVVDVAEEPVARLPAAVAAVHDPDMVAFWSTRTTSSGPRRGGWDRTAPWMATGW